MIYGYYAPLIIEKLSDHNGFGVRATDDIEKSTFICEYAGDVKNEIDNVDLVSDSIFTLVKTNSTVTT